MINWIVDCFVRCAWCALSVVFCAGKFSLEGNLNSSMFKHFWLIGLQIVSWCTSEVVGKLSLYNILINLHADYFLWYAWCALSILFCDENVLLNPFGTLSLFKHCLIKWTANCFVRLSWCALSVYVFLFLGWGN